MIRRLAATLAVLGTVAASAVAPAAAQQQATADLLLVRISPWARPGDRLVYQLAVRNRGQAALRGLQVDARLGAPVQTRSALASLLAAPAGPAAGRPLEPPWRPALAEVPAGATSRLEARTVTLPPGLGGDGAGAVLPLAVQLRAGSDAGTVTASLTTFVVVLRAEAASRLQVAMLVPLHEPTHRDAKGVFVDDGLAAQLAPTGPLGAIAAELDRPKAPKVTLVIDALLAEDAAAMAGAWRLRQGAGTTTVAAGDPRSEGASLFLKRLREAASANQPSAFPYATADLPGLVRAGLELEATNQVFQGRQLLQSALGTTPDQGLAWPVSGPVDGATLRTLANTGTDVVVLDPTLLPSTAPTTQNATVGLGAGDATPARALVPDQGLQAALADQRATSEPAAWAQRVLAETAVTWLERPNSPSPRGILLAPPQVWRPAPGFFRALVRGLAAAPWLTLERATTLAGRVPEGPDHQVRRLAPVTPAEAAAALPASYLRGVDQRRANLASFLRTVGADYPPSDGFDRDLRIAESSDWRPAAARPRGRGFIRAVDSGIRAVYRRVRVEPSRATLTARRGTIPVTVTNAGSQRMTVVLRLISPRVDLPATSQPFVLEPGRRTTQLVQVETRTTGTFRIAVQVLTQDQQRQITEAEVTLVSTAFNRVALALAGGAAGFLLLWWRRGRRRRRAAEDGRAGQGASP